MFLQLNSFWQFLFNDNCQKKRSLGAAGVTKQSHISSTIQYPFTALKKNKIK